MPTSEMSTPHGFKLTRKSVKVGEIIWLDSKKKIESERKKLADLVDELIIQNERPIAIIGKDSGGLSTSYYVYVIPTSQLTAQIKREHKEMREAKIEERKNASND